MKIISYNVNGIRAAATKGLFAWLQATDADMICLQEVKALAIQIPEIIALIEQLGSGVPRMLEVYDKSCFKFSLTLSE